MSVSMSFTLASLFQSEHATSATKQRFALHGSKGSVWTWQIWTVQVGPPVERSSFENKFTFLESANVCAVCLSRKLVNEFVSGIILNDCGSRHVGRHAPHAQLFTAQRRCCRWFCWRSRLTLPRGSCAVGVIGLFCGRRCRRRI